MKTEEKRRERGLFHFIHCPGKLGSMTNNIRRTLAGPRPRKRTVAKKNIRKAKTCGFCFDPNIDAL